MLPWMSGIGLTPYAAVQATAFDLPAYAESVVSGANTFALAYAAKTVTATRSEFGLRGDKSYSVGDAILTLRGRAAWAHRLQHEPQCRGDVPGALPGHPSSSTARYRRMTRPSPHGGNEIRHGFFDCRHLGGRLPDVCRQLPGKAIFLRGILRVGAWRPNADGACAGLRIGAPGRPCSSVNQIWEFSRLLTGLAITILGCVGVFAVGCGDRRARRWDREQWQASRR